MEAGRLMCDPGQGLGWLHVQGKLTDGSMQEAASYREMMGGGTEYRTAGLVPWTLLEDDVR